MRSNLIRPRGWLSSRFRPDLFSLEDRLTPAGWLDALTAGFAVVGPPPDEQFVTIEAPYSRTDIMAGLRGDSPLEVLRNDANLKTVIDVDGSRILLTATDGVHLTKLKLQPGVDPAVAVGMVRKSPNAAWAHVNTIVPNDVARDFTPNDPQYSKQYHHTLTQTNKAWDTETGEPTILIGIADDGVAYNHPDLSPNIYSNSKEAGGLAGADDDGNGYIDDIRGWDFSSDDANPLPVGSDTHGTHVAGISAARTNNATGVAGVSGGGSKGDGSRIVPLRWYGSGAWTAAVVAETLAYAADNGVQIFNSSYNIDGFAGDPTVTAGFNYAYDKGVLIFNSAGNNSELDPPRREFTQALMIASVTSTIVKSSFSNYGEFVDVSANGSNILSTTTSLNGTGVNYSSLSGTSMSTPHAAGAAALIWSAHPEWTRDQVAAQLIGTADSILSKNPSLPDQLGSGRINVYRGVTETLAAPKFTTVTGLPATGSGPVSQFSIRSGRLDPTAVVPASFELRGDGPNGLFDDADDVLIPITINGGDAYRMGVNTLTFTPTAGGLLPADNYRFTGFSGTKALRDPFGTPLDGDGNGTGGDNYVLFFNAAPAVGGRAFEDWNGDGLASVNDPGTAGRTIYLDLNNNGKLDGPPTFIQSTPMPIADVTLQTSTLAVSGLTGTLTDINVTLNISHTWDSDLDVTLISPGGTRVLLFSAVGGSGQNFINTTLDDEATNPIAGGGAPFTGSFIPAEALSKLDGGTPNGNWSLEIEDTAAQDSGTLNSWSLTMSTSTIVPEPVALTDASGQYGFFGVAAGKYTIRSQTPTGWTATSPESVVVTLATSNSAVSADFGTAKNNRFYENVYFDIDSDGKRDPDEIGVFHRLVYDDANNDKTYDGPVLNSVTNSTPMAINDLTTQTSYISVEGLYAPMSDVNVTIDLIHTWDSDLDIFLISPEGTRVALSLANGGDGDDYVGTTFDDEAATSIVTGVAPFSDSFQPQSPLSALDGERPNGTWGLEITDNAGADIGALNSWTLTFATGTGPESGTLTDSKGNSFVDLTPGPHTLRVAPGGGTTFTSPSDGSFAVTAAGVPLTGYNVGLVAGAAPQALSLDLPTQRSRILSLGVTFSEAMYDYSAGTGTSTFEITVTPRGGGAPFVLIPTVNWNFVRTVATLTFAHDAPDYRSLPEGRFTVNIVAANLRDGDGNYMAADVLFNGPSQFRLFGDSNGDGLVDGAVDFTAFGNAFNQTAVDSPFDFNDDGVIDNIDFVEFGGRFNVTL